ncbi:SPFH domain-containing protein [Candidatus Woesearchaeota archaeon]|nr:SPFH domain-containing protein [Candidatus Woesearchaeota archaeon]
MSDENGVAKYVPKRGTVKKIGKKILLTALAGTFAYALTAGVYGTKTIYKVKTNYAVVLERFGGNREIVKDVGWHVRAPFFTKYEKEVSLMQKEMYLNNDISPQTIVSSDKISLMVSGLLTYKVVDPYKWGIEIQNAEGLLQRDFDGMTKDVIQSSTETEIIKSREVLKNKIFQKLKTQPINIGNKTLEDKYGIEIISFNITHSDYPTSLKEASQRKKELELIADGESELINRTYNAHSEGVKKFMEATGMTKEQAVEYLNQQRWASAYEKSKDQKTFVINNGGNGLGLTLPSQDNTNKKLEEKVKALEDEIESLRYTSPNSSKLKGQDNPYDP